MTVDNEGREILPPWLAELASSIVPIAGPAVIDLERDRPAFVLGALGEPCRLHAFGSEDLTAPVLVPATTMRGGWPVCAICARLFDLNSLYQAEVDEIAEQPRAACWVLAWGRNLAAPRDSEHPKMFLPGSFTTILLHAIHAADADNRRRLSLVFPVLVETWELWMASQWAELHRRADRFGAE